MFTSQPCTHKPCEQHALVLKSILSCVLKCDEAEIYFLKESISSLITTVIEVGFEPTPPKKLALYLTHI